MLKFKFLISLIICLFPSQWDYVGPFPGGTREIGWDAIFDFNQETYYSELVNNGLINPQKTTAQNGMVKVEYPIDWQFLQKSFGPATLQHSTYFRGNLTVETDGIYLVAFRNIVSFTIDSKTFPGNFYSSRHSSESAVFLGAGVHQIFIQTSFDVRRDGIDSIVDWFEGSLRLVDMAVDHGVVVYPQDAIMPERIGDTLVSGYASVTVKNTFQPWPITYPTKVLNFQKRSSRSIHEAGWKQIVRIDCFDQDGIRLSCFITTFLILLAPGQTCAIPIKFDQLEHPGLKSLKVVVKLLDFDTLEMFQVDTGLFEIKEASRQVYKVTMDGYDHSIQYAIVKPPKTCDAWVDKKCPILVALHGAGVHLDSQVWIDAVDQQEYAWTIFPSGRTSWGFDWHGPSFRNIEATLDALLDAPGIPVGEKDKFGARIDRILWTGHSNGGQGAFWCASHYPDRTLGVLPAAGYIKLGLYVPFFMSVGHSFADPMLRGIMESAIAESDLDMYTSNLAGMPVLVRTGSLDENVPPLHSRRMVRLIRGWGSNLIEYKEDEGKGHWWDTVLKDDVATSFFKKHLNPATNPLLELPPLPNPFTISTMNPASLGSLGGVSILQPIVPYRLASIHVHLTGDHWSLTTVNVRRFGFSPDDRQKGIKTWSIDGTKFLTPPEDSGPSYLNKGNGTGTNSWELSSDLLWISRERNPTTYGPVFEIFNNPVIIVVPTNADSTSSNTNSSHYMQMALQITNSWYIYSRGSIQIIKDIEVLDGISAKYNLIVLGDPLDNFYTRRRTMGGKSQLLQFNSKGGILIGDKVYGDEGTGSLFLAPSPARTRLCLFITGIDQDGLSRAVGTIPFRTGVQVPDYLVVGKGFGDKTTGSGWSGPEPEAGSSRGLGGVLAAGYWSNEWEFQKDNGYLK